MTFQMSKDEIVEVGVSLVRSHDKQKPFTLISLCTAEAPELSREVFLIPVIAHRDSCELTCTACDQPSPTSTSFWVLLDFRKAFTFSRRSFSRSSVAVSVGERS